MRSWCGAALLAAALGCGAQETPLTGETATAPGQAEAAESEALATGRFSVAGDADSLTLRANRVRRSVLLEELARRFGFEMAGNVAEVRVTTDIADAALERVLVAILEGAPFSLRYGADEASERTSLVALELGVVEERTKAQDLASIARARVTERAASERRPQSVRDAEEEASEREAERPAIARAPRTQSVERLAEVRERRERRAEARRMRRLAKLESGDPDERVRGAFQLDARNPADLAPLGEALRDPEPRVRSQAARQLQWGDPEQVVPMLLAKLDDPVAEVVIEVIDALAVTGDASIEPNLEALLEHPAERVREEARSAMLRLD